MSSITGGSSSSACFQYWAWSKAQDPARPPWGAVPSILQPWILFTWVLFWYLKSLLKWVRLLPALPLLPPVSAFRTSFFQLHKSESLCPLSFWTFLNSQFHLQGISGIHPHFHPEALQHDPHWPHSFHPTWWYQAHKTFEGSTLSTDRPSTLCPKTPPPPIYFLRSPGSRPNATHPPQEHKSSWKFHLPSVPLPTVSRLWPVARSGLCHQS